MTLLYPVRNNEPLLGSPAELGLNFKATPSGFNALKFLTGPMSDAGYTG